ncbi:MAG: CAP domain-containing protein [Sandaracinaceae bacterium]
MRRLAIASFVLLFAPRSADAQTCVDDAALTRAAAGLLTDAGPLDAASVRRAASEAGSQLPTVYALLDADEPRRERAFLNRVGRHAFAPLRCGQARSEGRRLLLAGPSAGTIELYEDGAIRVELSDGWGDPQLYVQDRLGARHMPMSGGEARLGDAVNGPFVLQLVATGPDGPRPVAELRDGDAPIAMPTSGTILDALSALRNGHRMRENRLLERVASEHAGSIRATGHVTHLGRGGDPEARLARRGIRARHVGETAACATDELGALRAMLESPSHRAALLDRRFTDVGVGRSTAPDGRSCVVMLLASWPRAVPY